MDIGERIKLRREELGITQVALADAIGEKKQTLYKYENGIVTNIPIDKIALIAKALNTTPAFIMGWEETTKKEPAQIGKLSETDIRFLKVVHHLSDDKQRLLLQLAESLLAEPPNKE